MMISREIAGDERAAFDALALQHGTLFHRLEWLSLFGSQMRPIGLFGNGGELVGGWTLYSERRLGLRICRRAPFTPTCGPFLTVRSKNPVAALETRREALESMIAYLGGQHPAITMLPLDQSVQDVLPFIWHDYKVVPRYTYVLDLTASLEDIRRNMSPIRRNDISKGLRDGLTVETGARPDTVRELVLATFDRKGKRMRPAHLDAVLYRYANPSNSYTCTTLRNGTPIATSFIIHDGRTAYYLLGGYRPDDRHHGAGPLAVWEAICQARALGLQSFDFEGSVIPAIEKYFRGFGGCLTPYYTVNKAWLPLEMALKARKRCLF